MLRWMQVAFAQPNLVKERLHLVRNACRHAYELGKADAFAVALGDLFHGHGFAVVLLVDLAGELEVRLGPAHHLVARRKLEQVEVQVSREDSHTAFERD